MPVTFGLTCFQIDRLFTYGSIVQDLNYISDIKLHATSKVVDTTTLMITDEIFLLER